MKKEKLSENDFMELSMLAKISFDGNYNGEIPDTIDDFKKLASLGIGCLTVHKDEKGGIIGYCALLPTDANLLKNFKGNKITERVLLEAAGKGKTDGLHIAAIAVIPEKRMRGIGSSLLIEGLRHFKSLPKFCRIYSKEGGLTVSKIENSMNIAVVRL